MGIQIDRWMDDKSSHTSFIKQTNTCQLISDGLLFTGFREKKSNLQWIAVHHIMATLITMELNQHLSDRLDKHSI